ncbi:2-oxo acid dehydrogenase subunit E2, partial [Streptobacillus moniliformis]|uniref:2-oxo acid dehydrogenase subunit E2 n=1 Tax=Streptobacillus moniliformis TaxID=34105 RepID=UPI000A40EFC5
MSAIRKVIAKRMVESYLTASTFTVKYDVDMSETLALRKKLLERMLAQTGKKVTVTDMISLALIKTLMRHKYL